MLHFAAARKHTNIFLFYFFRIKWSQNKHTTTHVRCAMYQQKQATTATSTITKTSAAAAARTAATNEKIKKKNCNTPTTIYLIIITLKEEKKLTMRERLCRNSVITTGPGACQLQHRLSTTLFLILPSFLSLSNEKLKVKVGRQTKSGLLQQQQQQHTRWW